MINLGRSNLPDGCRLSVNQTVSNFDIHGRDYPVQELLRQQMTQQLADEISKKRVTTKRGEYSTEYRIDLVVLSVDEFYGVVQKCAQAMYMRPMYSIDKCEEPHQ